MSVIDEIGRLTRLPFGFVVVFFLLGTAVVSVLTPFREGATVLGPLLLAFVLFAPGYAVLAVLFPTHEPDGESGLTGTERLTFSFVLSIVIVPLIGYGLNFTAWGVRREPVLVSVIVFTSIGVALGLYRRQATRPRSIHPYRPRASNPFRRWARGVYVGLFGSKTNAGHLLSIVLVLSVVLALGSVAYAVTTPQNEETYTEFSLLTENETGELVADGYPEQLADGESVPLVVGIENRELEPTPYTVVVLDQRMENGEMTAEREQQRFRTTLDDGETWQQDHEMTPTLTGEQVRVTYLLYDGDPPDSPSVDNADDSLHIWVSVSSSET